MLAADERCKAPAGDAISLPERTHDELALFLAFLYTGALEDDGGGGCLQVPEERQLHALLVAADKYDVPFLRRACEARLAAAVDASKHAGGRGAELQRSAQGARHGHGGRARRAGGVLARVRRLRRQQRRAVRRHHPGAAAGQDADCR